MQFAGAKSKLSTATEHQATTKAQTNEDKNKSSSNGTTANGTEQHQQTPPTQTTATTQIDNNNQTKNKSLNETLDLADLDLSQLRLTKKDLETLSTITPNLPKHFQQQLLAQLPPTQARKLSRTLSMQGGAQPHVYKRSLSGGREIPEKSNSVAPKTPTVFEDDQQSADTPFDRNSVLRRSISRSRETSSGHRRSTSGVHTDLPSRLSYTGDLRSDYNANKASDSLASRYRLNEYTSALPPSSVRSDYYSKLPTPGKIHS